MKHLILCCGLGLVWYYFGVLAFVSVAVLIEVSHRMGMEYATKQAQEGV